MSIEPAFKLLRGRTILVNIPERPESKIKLSDKDEANIMKDAVKLWSRLVVFAVGDRVEDVNVGDQVYIRTGALDMEHVEKIDIDGKLKFILNEGDVIIIW